MSPEDSRTALLAAELQSDWTAVVLTAPGIRALVETLRPGTAGGDA